MLGGIAPKNLRNFSNSYPFFNKNASILGGNAPKWRAFFWVGMLRIHHLAIFRATPISRNRNVRNLLRRPIISP